MTSGITRARQGGRLHSERKREDYSDDVQQRLVVADYSKGELKLRNVFELFSQHRASAPAKGQGYSIIHLYEHIALRRQIKFLNVIKIHDRISMNAEKAIWVEQNLERLDALPN